MHTQAHYSATLRLKRFFPFTLIDAMVRRHILQQTAADQSNFIN